MSENKIKYRLKGHGSFYIREGWLRKGIKNINDSNNPTIFSDQNAQDKLGVGSAMVKAIRYWLQVTGLTYEKRIKNGNGKRGQYLTEEFGEIINKYDPYFEDIFTLWLLHYKIATNFEMCTSWYLFFNRLNAEEFNKEDIFENLKYSLIKEIKNEDFSINSLKDDCTCIIKTYLSENDKSIIPEDNTVCPFTELGLLSKNIFENGSEKYVKRKPSIDKLDKLVIYYIILDRLQEDKEYITIDNLLNDDCNVGKILNLDRNTLNIYLDRLRYSGYITINRTAGLDIIYLKEMDKLKIIEKYYKQQEDDVKYEI